MADSKSSEVLDVILKISRFALKVQKDLKENNDVEYGEEKLHLPEFIENTAKYLATTLKTRQQAYNFDYLLDQPARVERLKAHFTETLYKNVIFAPTLDFVEWSIMCCFIAARLFHGGFIEAPDVAVETVHKMVLDYGHTHEFVS